VGLKAPDAVRALEKAVALADRAGGREASNPLQAIPCRFGCIVRNLI